MKLILNKCDHSVVMQVKLNQGASVIEELLPFDCLNCNGLNFMKLLLNMYEVKFHQGVISNRVVIAL